MQPIRPSGRSAATRDYLTMHMNPPVDMATDTGSTCTECSDLETEMPRRSSPRGKAVGGWNSQRAEQAVITPGSRYYRSRAGGSR